MKLLNPFVMSSLLLFSIACEKKIEVDTCDGSSLEETIVGSWIVDGTNGGEVEFKSDGTLIDDNDVLCGVQDVHDEKTYVIDSNSSLTISSETDDFSGEVEFGVKSYACEEIILDVFIYEIKLTRK